MLVAGMLVTAVEYKEKYVCVGLSPLDNGYRAYYLYTFKGKRYPTKEEAVAAINQFNPHFTYFDTKDITGWEDWIAEDNYDVTKQMTLFATYDGGVLYRVKSDTGDYLKSIKNGRQKAEVFGGVDWFMLQRQRFPDQYGEKIYHIMEDA